MEWTFIESPFFMKRREKLFKNDEAFRQFQLDLMVDPEEGDPIPGGAGIRKIREVQEGKGKGKSGGLRVIYLQVPETREIYLFHVYPKGIKDDLSQDEISALANAAREIKKLALSRKRSKK